MKNSKILSHIPLIFVLYLILMQTVNVHWIAQLIPIPWFSQVLTLFIYLPFIVFVIMKVWSDVQRLRCREFSAFSAIFYLFSLYFLVLSTVRYICGSEVKDSAYYVIVLCGSLSLAELILRRRLCVNKSSLQIDICILAIFLALYRLIWCIIEPVVNHNVMPINGIAMGAMLLFAFPVAVHIIRSADRIGVRLIAAIAALGAVLVVLTLSSRIMFAGLCTEIVILLILFLIDRVNRKRILHFASVVLCALIIVAVLIVLDVGNVRYSVYRATSLGIFYDSPADIPKDETQERAEDQIERSDSLRKRLMEFGFGEAKKNVLFGTGNVYLQITDFGYIARVPVHNGFLQMMVAFGMIGTLMVLSMIVSLLWAVTPRKWSSNKLDILNLGLALCVYGVLSLVQATSFDVLVLPSAMLSAGVFMRWDHKALRGTNNGEEIEP